jgi:hypothetical protein
MPMEIGLMPNGNRVTIEYESRVEGPGPHVFIYDGRGRKYRVAVRRGKLRSKLLMSSSVVWKAIVGLLNKARSATSSQGDKMAKRWAAALAWRPWPIWAKG